MKKEPEGPLHPELHYVKDTHHLPLSAKKIHDISLPQTRGPAVIVPPASCSSVRFKNFSSTSRSETSKSKKKRLLRANVASLSLLRGVMAFATSKLVLTKATGREAHRTLSGPLAMQIPLLERAGIGAIAGAVAGGFTNGALHPIDTVKTKLQARGASAIYSGPIDVVQKVFASHGLRGFYAGFFAATYGSMFSSGIYFGTYELGKGLLSRVPRIPKLAVPPLAAALGNVASSAILVPKEVVKQRMQAGAVGTSREVLLRTLSIEGVGGLYSGYNAALLRNLPANVINFSTFEYLKGMWLKKTGKDSLEPWQSVLSGAVSGAISAAATTPLDVVKTRLMTQARAAVSIAGSHSPKEEAAARAQAIASYTYRGVASSLRRIWEEEGYRGLFRGISPRLLYSSCFSALGFFTYELCKTILLLHQLNQQDKAKPKPVAPAPAPAPAPPAATINASSSTGSARSS